MPVHHRTPNINARRLGSYLRRLREILELSYGEAAALLGCDANWLARVETGFGVPGPDDVSRLLDGYHVPPHKMRSVLIDLASRPAGPLWLGPHTDRLKPLVRDLLTLESESPFIQTFGITSLPALVRTEEYARMLFAYQIPEVDPDQEWDLLSHRQRHRPGGIRRTLDVILDEGTLTIIKGRERIVREQLAHLIALSEEDDTTVRVIPLKVGAHAGLGGPFDVLRFPDLGDTLSLVHSALGVSAAPVDLTDTWELLERVALPPAESRDMIARIAAGEPAQARGQNEKT